MFGGVHDDMEDEEQLDGTFFNELLALDLEKYQWRCVNLTGKKEASAVRRRRRKAKEGASESEGESEADEEENEESTSKVTAQPAALVTDDDGIFTVSPFFYFDQLFLLDTPWSNAPRYFLGLNAWRKLIGQISDDRWSSSRAFRNKHQRKFDCKYFHTFAAYKRGFGGEKRSFVLVRRNVRGWRQAIYPQRSLFAR